MLSMFDLNSREEVCLRCQYKAGHSQSHKCDSRQPSQLSDCCWGWCRAVGVHMLVVAVPQTHSTVTVCCVVSVLPLSRPGVSLCSCSTSAFPTPFQLIVPRVLSLALPAEFSPR